MRSDSTVRGIHRDCGEVLRAAHFEEGKHFGEGKDDSDHEVRRARSFPSFSPPVTLAILLPFLMRILCMFRLGS